MPAPSTAACRPGNARPAAGCTGAPSTGTLLKHHIPIRTQHWDVTTPGFLEADLVSHSGNWADGEFLQSLNLTDIHTGWVESRAVLGKTQRAVRAAVAPLRVALPFPLRGLDSDNGAEVINRQFPPVWL